GHHHHHDRRPPRYRECRGYHCRHDVEANVGAESEVAQFANRHQISLAAAEKIQEAFSQVSVEGLNAFSRIGFEEKDIRSIANRSVPADSSLAKMALSLDISTAQARRMMQDAVADFSVQASDVESDYWQACMAEGKWKTPENTNCKSTSWPGCSPEQGATLCY
ncbi:MAG: hypothetical protein AAGB31_14855, partial [Bdellovibrio sp.]